MVILKTKTKKGYGTVTLEHISLKGINGAKYTGYATKKDGKLISAVRGNKKDATDFFKRECERVFGSSKIGGK